MLDPPVAQEVSDTITAAIGHNVLITDDHGIVIGSGDTARVGSFHEASMPVIARAAGAHHDEAGASRLEGVLPGVTLPLLLGGRVVGTVGITGPPEVVQRFGEIVRIQTEIMLRETMLVRLAALRERALEELFGALTSFDADLLSEEALTTRAAELGYHLDLPRVAAVLAVESEPVAKEGERSSEAPRSLRIDLVRTVRTVFARSQDLVAAVGQQGIGVLCEVNPGDRSQVRPRRLCARAIGELQARHRVTCRAGIGQPGSVLDDLRQSYEDAWTALRLGRRLDPEQAIYHTEEYRVPDLLLGVSVRSRQRYRTQTLGSLPSQSNWSELRRTIMAWCESGYRLVDTARTLKVHRNTLVYRLERLEELTGSSLRDYRHAFALYLACLLTDLEAVTGSQAPEARTHGA